jgi:hypothetical protein
MAVPVADVLPAVEASELPLASTDSVTAQAPTPYARSQVRLRAGPNARSRVQLR